MKDKYGYFLAVAAIIVFGAGALSLVHGPGTADVKTTIVDTAKPDEDDESRFYIKDLGEPVSSSMLYVIIDDETGVEYALFNNGGGICPLYNQDGTLRIDERFLEEAS